MDEVQLKTPVMEVIKRKTAFGNRTVIDMPPAVMVIAIDEANNVHLLEEHMAPQNGFMATFAKGAIDAGEAPEAAARRELEEELGLRAGKMQLLLHLKNQPSHMTAETFVYVAQNCTQVENPAAGDEADGSIRHITVPLEALLNSRAAYFKCARCLAASGELRIQQLEADLAQAKATLF